MEGAKKPLELNISDIPLNDGTTYTIVSLKDEKTGLNERDLTEIRSAFACKLSEKVESYLGGYLQEDEEAGLKHNFLKKFPELVYQNPKYSIYKVLSICFPGLAQSQLIQLVSFFSQKIYTKYTKTPKNFALNIDPPLSNPIDISTPKINREIEIQGKSILFYLKRKFGEAGGQYVFDRLTSEVREISKKPINIKERDLKAKIVKSSLEKLFEDTEENFIGKFGNNFDFCLALIDPEDLKDLYEKARQILDSKESAAKEKSTKKGNRSIDPRYNYETSFNTAINERRFYNFPHIPDIYELVDTSEEASLKVEGLNTIISRNIRRTVQIGVESIIIDRLQNLLGKRRAEALKFLNDILEVSVLYKDSESRQKKLPDSFRDYILETVLPELKDTIREDLIRILENNCFGGKQELGKVFENLEKRKQKDSKNNPKSTDSTEDDPGDDGLLSFFNESLGKVDLGKVVEAGLNFIIQKDWKTNNESFDQNNEIKELLDILSQSEIEKDKILYGKLLNFFAYLESCLLFFTLESPTEIINHYLKVYNRFIGPWNNEFIINQSALEVPRISRGVKPAERVAAKIMAHSTPHSLPEGAVREIFSKVFSTDVEIDEVYEGVVADNPESLVIQKLIMLAKAIANIIIRISSSFSSEVERIICIPEIRPSGMTDFKIAIQKREQNPAPNSYPIIVTQRINDSHSLKFKMQDLPNHLERKKIRREIFETIRKYTTSTSPKFIEDLIHDGLSKLKVELLRMTFKPEAEITFNEFLSGLKIKLRTYYDSCNVSRSDFQRDSVVRDSETLNLLLEFISAKLHALPPDLLSKIEFMPKVANFDYSKLTSYLQDL